MNMVVKGVKFNWSFRKFIINMIIVSIVFCSSILYLTNSAKATSEKKVYLITVRYGDTLWSIAQRISPDSDPRVVIDQIKSDNLLRDSRLTTGQTLKITECN